MSRDWQLRLQGVVIGWGVAGVLILVVGPIVRPWLELGLAIIGMALAGR